MNLNHAVIVYVCMQPRNVNQKCEARHYTILHQDDSSFANQIQTVTVNNGNFQKRNSNEVSLSSGLANRGSRIILSTTSLIKVFDNKGKTHIVRAFQARLKLNVIIRFSSFMQTAGTRTNQK